jgi:hypothetical protein
MNRFLLAVAVFALGTFSAHALAAGESRPNLIACCKAENDLYRVLVASKIPITRVNTAAEAVAAAAAGDGLLILADGDSPSPVMLPPRFFEEAIAKRLRLYVEFPESLPGLNIGKPRAVAFERLVVSSDFFGPSLRPLRIMGVNGMSFMPAPIKAEKAHIVAARVAGVDRAVYGLPEETFPILFEHSQGKVLVATAGLSHFVTGRYAPADAWRSVWAGVLNWLAPGSEFPELKWTPTVRPTFAANETLPADVERTALRRGLAWYRNSKLIPPESRRTEIEKSPGKLPVPPPDSPDGDGSLGICEAMTGVVRNDGSQLQGTTRRGDCNGESAAALALAAKALGDPKATNTAGNILDYWFNRSGSRVNEWGDPSHGAYGLIAWSLGSPANYGDDNARLLLGTMAASQLVGTDHYDRPMMMCLLAQLRTTGRLGFRGDCLYIKQLGREGWQHYFDRKEFVNYSPHMEAYLWACFLWAYERTGYDMFYQRAENAIRMTMKQHTDGWRWTNGLAQERARMMLPLAWLVRVEDTPEHRRWLHTCAEGLCGLQQPCGAIREELGLPGHGMFAPPRVNRHYGLSESPLIQENGDTISDLLYTTNFAFLGLHEAAAATGDAFYRDAEDKLAKFLCRIQTASTAHPELDGGWYRGFDYGRWEYWASNSDPGWGVWCIESGWTQGWITSTFAMRQLNTSLWDFARQSHIEKNFDALRKEMLPDAAIAGTTTN